MARTALSSLIEYFGDLSEPTEFTLESLYELVIDHQTLAGQLRRFNYTDIKQTPVLQVNIDLFLFQRHKALSSESTVTIYKPVLVYYPQEKELQLRDFDSLTSPRQSVMENLLADMETSSEVEKVEELLLVAQK